MPASSTTTNTRLLQGLLDPGNQEVWRQFVDRYRPLIVRYLRRVGVPAEDAEDVAQNALLAFATAYRDGRYDRALGRLRSWLFGIVRTHVLSWSRGRRRAGVQICDAPDETGFFARIEAPPGEADKVWEEEWAAAALYECLLEVRRSVDATTFEAFELFALKGEPADRVGERLGITRNAVYLAKRRVLRRVRELRPLIEDIW